MILLFKDEIIKFTADQLKSATKNAIEITLRLLKIIIGTNGSKFPQNLRLTDRWVSSFARLLEIIHPSV